MPYVVAAFGMVLGDSEHCGQMNLETVHELARPALGPDSNGYRREFIELFPLIPCEQRPSPHLNRGRQEPAKPQTVPHRASQSPNS